MIIGFEKSDITHWKEELHNYEQRKIGKLPFEKQTQKQFIQLEAVLKKQKILESPLKKYTSSQIKTSKQFEDKIEIDRSLNKYKNNRYKYEKDYDIISPHPLGESMIESEFQKRKKNNAPIRNLYNIINGQKLPGEFLKERHIVLPKQYSKKDVSHSREFNIVNLQYKTNNQTKQQMEMVQKEEQIMKKYNSSHVYDKIYGRYYSPQQEEKYWTEKKVENIKNAQIASQKYQEKFPKSYQSREPFIQDFTKPLPKKLQQLDKIRESSKQNRQAKYIFQTKHQIKNIQQAEKAEIRSKNKYRKTNDMRLNKSSFVASKIEEKRQHLGSGKIKSYGFS